MGITKKPWPTANPLAMALKRQPLPLEDVEELWSLVDRYQLTLSAIGVELTEDGTVVVAEKDSTWKAVVAKE